MPDNRSTVLLTQCAGMFLVQLDVTVVNVALPTIGARFQAGVPALQWIVDGYTVVLAALLLSGGALGDAIGHRRVVLAGLGVFGLASAGCALAPGTTVLVVFRVAQGIGAALLLPGTLAVITRTFPGRREQARALGIWAGVSALALAAGPLLGGLLVTAVGWRSLFWINVPLTALAAAGTLLVPADPPGGRRIDVRGTVTGAIALASLVYAVIQSNIPAAVLGVIAAVAFVAAERTSPAPMLPLTLLRSRTFAAANVVAGAMNFVGLGTILLATLYLQGVHHAGPLTAGLAMLPGFLPLSLLAPVTGRLTARFGPRPVMIAGLVTGAAGLLGLLRVTPVSGLGTFLIAFFFLGVGLGLLTAAVVAAAVGGVPAGQAGVASGVNNTARQACGALGIATFGALAGSPAQPASFVHGLHTAGVLGAALYGAAAVLTAVAVRRPSGNAVAGGR
ncbi:MFS transporter [Amycolatopsis thermophila]|uniref:DHA2 family methylenomycin A resistance protein-like MFS transporter n=1 Tax=Amycolatopsis thermophila TaxID=206084 RepID=A0ABU0F413_9PSEU|nr:MFS transporter [Amycolatopsis thermophila]MDQ0382319.1 DHA2 family methylenomycin A resistance protein-like MFS transporter [Amycolatopsis thermophila]